MKHEIIINWSYTILLDNGFCIDVIFSSNKHTDFKQYTEFWLYNNNYGIKELIYGCDTSNETIDETNETIVNYVEYYNMIECYKQEYMQE